MTKMGFSAPAAAESHIFIIPNNPDGYGVDRCLANGERCGAVVATTYCQSQSFAQARSFRRIDRDEITGAASSSGRNACVGSCDSFVAIERSEEHTSELQSRVDIS